MPSGSPKRRRTRKRKLDMCESKQCSFFMLSIDQHFEWSSGLFREKVSAAMFFKHNTQLGPPYQVLVDTNFINFSIKNKVKWKCGRSPFNFK
jgi:hypothetical protein